MTGILRNNLPDFSAEDPFDALVKTAELGFDRCLFNSLLDLDRSLDRQVLRDLKATADDLGVGLAAGIGWINPMRPERGKPIAAFGDGDIGKGIIRFVEAASDLGLADMFFMIGTVEDRFDQTISWSEQLEAVGTLLAGLSPVLRDRGFRLNLKTHEEITSFEILRLVEMTGPDVIGVALDPVNAFVRLEDPLKAAQRLATHVRQVHLDDAIVQVDGDVLRRLLCPMGQGDIDWSSILALVPRVPWFVDLHRGQFTMAAFDPAFHKHQPEQTVGELAAVLKIAVCRKNKGANWNQSDPAARLSPMLEYLKSLNG